MKLKYGRKSGTANTSLGNTLLNAITFHMIEMFKGKVSIAFMLGDDNLFASNTYFSKESIIAAYA
jgi:hypothetical protein